MHSGREMWAGSHAHQDGSFFGFFLLVSLAAWFVA